MLRKIRKAFHFWSRRAPVVPDDEAELALLTSQSEEAHSQSVPYDENLLERARSQWQVGDWESLVKLDRDTLQHHPDRAMLALLAAAGHQQLSDLSAARQFARLATDWGCSKKLLSRILIAGVHNTLGRAAAAAQQRTRALKHLEAAVAPGASGTNKRLLTRARLGSQLAQLGLARATGLPVQFAGSYGVQANGPSRDVSRADEATTPIDSQLLARNDHSDARREQQHAEVLALRTDLTNILREEMLNAKKQLEAFLEVHNYFNTGELLPAMHEWPISPDFALYLIELLETNDYDLIVEFGSGTSTVLMAKALSKIGTRRPGKMATRQVAFEHLERYHAATLASLRRAGPHHEVELVHAPLQPYIAPNGTIYRYYACHDTLAEIARTVGSAAGLRLLVVVDGPPGDTGPHARYPAVPMVLTHFDGAQIDVLLDDYARPDEHEIAQMWLIELRARGHEVSFLEKKMEKEACLLRISRKEKTATTTEPAAPHSLYA